MNWQLPLFVGARNALKKLFANIDYPLLLMLMLLASAGLITLYSSAGQDMELVWKQARRLAIGFLLLLVFASVPLSVYKRWAWLLYALGVVLLALVWFAGEVGKGAQRWLNLWLLTFQPSELLKLATPLFLCMLFASFEESRISVTSVLIALAIIALPVALVAIQPDLGTAVLICIAGLWVIFLTEISWRWILLFIVLVISSSLVAWDFLHDYQQQRVLVFLNPENDPIGTGYHIYQSKIAIGSGGLWGKGWLEGTQVQLGFVPEQSTDFIFSVFDEEFGFVGCTLLILIYLAIIVSECRAAH